MKLLCKQCGSIYDRNFSGWRCTCGSSLWLDGTVTFGKQNIRRSVFSMWRYADAYPVGFERLRVSLGEGMTPLTPANLGGLPVLVKNDSLMPTGSFKDRGVAMVVNGMASRGVRRMTEDSSGNAGSSFAAYCACAGMTCDLFIPAGTSSGKVGQARCFGANVHQVTGSRDDVALAAQAGVEGSEYGGHNWHPLFVEGVKSVAYEIWEQNGFSAPDNIVCPVGNGSLVVGSYLGFRELLENGEIDTMPRLFGVQAENCNTTYRMFKGLPIDYDVRKTVAEGISLYRPGKAAETAAIIGETSGDMAAVTEEEIAVALGEAVRAGFFIEPTSAVAFAGLGRFAAAGSITAGQTTVVIVSGNGLKALDTVLSLVD